jgi:hypothetical protein
MAKVRKSDGEGTFAGMRSNDRGRSLNPAPPAPLRVLFSGLPSDRAPKGPQRHRGRPGASRRGEPRHDASYLRPRSDRPCVPMKSADTTATIIRDLRPATDRRERIGSHANRVRRRFWRAPLPRTPARSTGPLLLASGDLCPREGPMPLGRCRPSRPTADRVFSPSKSGRSAKRKVRSGWKCDLPDLPWRVMPMR